MNPLIIEIRKEIQLRHVYNKKVQFIIPIKNLAVLEVLFIYYDIMYEASGGIRGASPFGADYLRVPMLNIEEVWLDNHKSENRFRQTNPNYLSRTQKIEEQIFMTLNYKKLAVERSISTKTPSGDMFTKEGDEIPFKTFQQAETINRHKGPARYIHWLEKSKDENGRDICLRTARWPTI